MLLYMIIFFTDPWRPTVIGCVIQPVDTSKMWMLLSLIALMTAHAVNGELIRWVLYYNMFQKIVFMVTENWLAPPIMLSIEGNRKSLGLFGYFHWIRFINYENGLKATNTLFCFWLLILGALHIIYTYKTWILFVCSHFPKPPKVPGSWNLGSRPN